MFARFFAPNPVKTMQEKLAAHCPDPSLWDGVAAYLVAGRQPSDQRAQAALRAYIDLRDRHCGVMAFKSGSELSHAALDETCRDFFDAYQGAPALSSGEQEAWARFLLAADHLLAEASAARVAQGMARGKVKERLEAELAKVESAYFAPLSEAARSPQPMEPEAEAELDPALAA